ncbi:MAG: hypothetical protein EAZ37_06230 [Burkholderiales bacterium]|nr:MAG: hypothetical protein EAZ37_06230 [Burkholderiales bacterium]
MHHKVAKKHNKKAENAALGCVLLMYEFSTMGALHGKKAQFLRIHKLHQSSENRAKTGAQFQDSM